MLALTQRPSSATVRHSGNALVVCPRRLSDSNSAGFILEWPSWSSNRVMAKSFMNRSRSISEQLAVCDAQQVKPQGAGPRSPRKVVAVIDEYSFTGRESGMRKPETPSTWSSVVSPRCYRCEGSVDMRFRQFLMRGKGDATAEWGLVCAACNFLKNLKLIQKQAEPLYLLISSAMSKNASEQRYQCRCANATARI